MITDRSDRGSILFIILISIILFSALSYAVTNSMSSNGNDASKERQGALVASLMQNMSLLENTIMRAKLVDGVPEHGFDFSYTGGWASNNSACTTANCEIFDVIPVFEFPDWALATEFPPYFWSVRILNVGTDAPELVIAYRGISSDVCNAINSELGLGDIDAPTDSWGWVGGVSAYYTGTLSAFPAGYATLGNTNAALKGLKSFCFSGSEGYYFIHVLMER